MMPSSGFAGFNLLWLARGEAVAEEIYSILTHPEEKKEALEVGKERRG